MRDIFKSVPAEGAFEVTPDGSEKVIIAPKGGNTGWGGNCQLDIHLPIV